jgi:hypothetical protein
MVRLGRVALEGTKVRANASKRKAMNYDEPAPPAPCGRIPQAATAKQRMARKVSARTGPAAYARRKGVPLLQNAKQLLLRGHDAARDDCHPLRTAAVDGCNEALVARVAETKLLRINRLRADTTVVPADVAYPTDSGRWAQGDPADRGHRPADLSCRWSKAHLGAGPQASRQQTSARLAAMLRIRRARFPSLFPRTVAASG